MGKKRKGKCKKNAQKGQVDGYEEEQFKKEPHTFVFARGEVGRNVRGIVRDLRRVMEPYTASKLKTKRNNVLKDFVSVAGLLNVSHFIMLSKTDESNHLRLARLPRGPTLSFNVSAFTLARDVISSIRRNNMEPRQFQHQPLLVMNGFPSASSESKLITSMFQNMFPSLNVQKLKLNDVRRCVLLNYNADDKSIDFRHYNIRAVPVGTSKGVKKLIRTKVPNMSKYNDMSDFLLGGGGNISESEAEPDGDHNTVRLPQAIGGRGNINSCKSAIRLTEIGPRLTLQLVKIQEGMCEGETMFHEFVHKTSDQVNSITKKRDKKQTIKVNRKKIQEENVMKKQQKRAEHKVKSLAGMKQESDGDDEADDESDSRLKSQKVQSDSEDDVDYFRKEVGEEPDKELFPKRAKKSKVFRPGSKRKYEEGKDYESKRRKTGESYRDTRKSWEEGDKKTKRPMTVLETMQKRKKYRLIKKLKRRGLHIKGNKAPRVIKTTTRKGASNKGGRR